MPHYRRLITLARAAALVISLAGCTTPGVVEPAEPPAPPAEATLGDEGFPTGCLIDRVWSVDISDLANQLLTNMQSQGSSATSVTGSGEMTMLFAEDALVNAGADVTFTVQVPVADGAIMTGEQRQVGSGTGEWYWESARPGVVAFEGWEADYDIVMTMTLNGTVVNAPIELPSSGPDGTAMAVTCEGDTLTTQSDGSPFIQRWTAVT